MVLLTAEEFEKSERVLANLLLEADEQEQAKILALHDQLTSIFASQANRRAQLHHLRSLTEKTVQ